jgi:Na+/serine symporter
LAFGVIALISSGMLSIFDSHAIASNTLNVAVGFMVGYFSDSANAKLTEIADTLFGVSRGREKHRENSGIAPEKLPE